MKKLLLLLIFFACLIASSQAQGWRAGEMEVKVQIHSKTDALDLYNLKLNGDIYLRHALLYLTPAELSLLDDAGFDYEITIENLNEYSQNFWGSRAEYHSYQEIIDLADSLATHFPDICTKHLFGTSMGGRQLAALKISDNSATDENEAEVMFDGGIHGDEIGGPENVIRFARDLCLGYGSDPEMTELIDNREIWLYLMVNPDGRVGMIRYNNNGVDLNRDWGYMWNGEGSSSGAFSQVESKALRACSYSHQFVVHTTYHSGTEYISCPWSYRPQAPFDAPHILQLAGLYADVSGYSNIPYGQGYNGMYAINGSTKDSNYGAMGSISWSMEISQAKQPPASQIMTYYNYNKPAMLTMIEYSGYGLEGLVTDAVTGDPVAAVIFVNDFIPTFTDPEVGDYHKYVLPGNYSIMVKANGYQDKLVSGISVSAMNSTITDIELDPLDHQSVYRMISSQIPDNNHSDEGYTWNAIGQPDNQNYSIGKNGWAVLDMQDVIFDGPGPDLMVFEGDASAEGYTLYAGESMDGPWHSMGDGSGTTEFDFAACNISEAQYFKIQDDGDGSASGNDVGFDLDAIQALSSITGPYVIMEGYEVDDASGNGNGLLEPGETADFIVTLKNVGTETALALTGTFTSEDDYITIITTEAQSFGDLEIDASAIATFIVSAEESAPAGHISVINFNYEGSNVDPNTKYISIEFPDYCEASTSTEDEYISNVECGDISNASGWQGGVADYSDMSTALDTGAAVDITVTNGNAWSSDQVSAWVDWNNDFELGNSTGETFVLTNVGGSGETFTGSIQAPEDQNSGIYRMRIRMTYSSDPNPCGSSSYGEVEDYSIVVNQTGINAAFTSDESWICYGQEVHFYDISSGDIISWEWEFPGGTPATSNEQNPVIAYNEPGIFGVTLTVSDGSNTAGTALMEYIIADNDPAAPSAPEGLEEMCQNSPDCEYSISDLGGCIDWYWEMLPANAGIMSQSGPMIEVDWADDFAGDVQIMAAGINHCGQSEMSEPIEITIIGLPAAAGEIDGADMVCHNQSGQYFVDEIAGATSYEWILDPAEAGTIMANQNECTIAFTGPYLGVAFVQVRGINNCGEGNYSPPFEVYIDPCPGIGEAMADEKVQILPNPSNGNFEIAIQNYQDEQIRIQIFSPSGAVVYQSEIAEIIPGNNLAVNLSDLPAGIYYLKLVGKMSTLTKKIAIHK